MLEAVDDELTYQARSVIGSGLDPNFTEDVVTDVNEIGSKFFDQ